MAVKHVVRGAEDAADTTLREGSLAVASFEIGSSAATCDSGSGRGNHTNNNNINNNNNNM